MSSSDIAICISNLSKCYQIYDTPRDRLKQFILPRLQRTTGQLPKQYFREFWALKDVSFEVKKGETVGIIGRNGSGKSTLLQIICGTLSPSSGGVKTNGRIAALLELGSGFNPEFTGHENVYMNASVLGLSKEEIDARFDDIAAFADIGQFIEQPVKTYSSGMVVRLAFAVIAHVDADILVVDEALAVGDAFFTQKCMRFLRNFMKTGTVLFVSHDTGAVRGLCSHVIWLDAGVVQMMGTPKIISEKYLEAIFEAQQESNTDSKSKVIVSDKQTDEVVDQRKEFINNSNLRNDIEIYQFHGESEGVGVGGAEIVNISILDHNGRKLSWMVGGELVRLRVEVNISTDIESPIVGFLIKDKLGQNLFGDNTHLSHLDSKLSASAGEYIEAEFAFQMPRLAKGDYFVTAAMASGTQENHIQHHWLHDAVAFKSFGDVGITGIIGLPMSEIILSKKLALKNV